MQQNILQTENATRIFIIRWSEPAPGGVTTTSEVYAGYPFGKLSPLMMSLTPPPLKYNTDLKRYLRRLSPLVGYGDGESRGLYSSGAIDGVPIHAQGLNASPFPALDEFVCQHVNRNGAPGHVSSWAITHTSDHSDRNGIISGTTYGFKMTYQIAGNKFCARIGRQHKSNHIMIVVDCTRGCMCQRCWDPDCRGFSSNEIVVPALVLPSFEELQCFVAGAIETKSYID